MKTALELLGDFGCERMVNANGSFGYVMTEAQLEALVRRAREEMCKEVVTIVAVRIARRRSDQWSEDLQEVVRGVNALLTAQPDDGSPR